MLVYTATLTYWCSVILVALLTVHSSALSAASAYGKLATPTPRTRLSSPASPHPSSLSSFLLSPPFYLSNGRCFTAYYTVASLLNALVLLSLHQWHSTPHPTPLLIRTLLTLDHSASTLLPFSYPPPIPSAVGGLLLPPSSSSSSSSSLLQLHWLLQLHYLRRLGECVFVHRFSSSQQHALVLLFGTQTAGGR